jgi:hypothetical protein
MDQSGNSSYIDIWVCLAGLIITGLTSALLLSTP